MRLFGWYVSPDGKIPMPEKGKSKKPYARSSTSNIKSKIRIYLTRRTGISGNITKIQESKWN